MKKNETRIITALKLVNQIQRIRSKNNKNWMDLLKLALRLDFKNTSHILKDICKEDRLIANLAKKISKLK